MKLNEIQDLIKFVAKSGVSEVEVETKDIKIIIKTPASKSKDLPVVQQAAPVQTAAPVVHQIAAPVAETKAPEVKPAVAADDAKYVTIKSPMIGTFYRTAGPDKPAFVEVGTDIKKGDKLCIIEAMKTFNEIEAEISGKIIKVLVDNSNPVDYDQPLFLVDPS